MKKLMLFALIAALFTVAACSTTARFKTPEGTKLVINGVPLTTLEMEKYKTSPFFWDKTGGIPYKLEKSGKTIEEGTLQSNFRIASLFWPPFAIIYWPMGFKSTYDFTEPNDKVRPNKAK